MSKLAIVATIKTIPGKRDSTWRFSKLMGNGVSPLSPEHSSLKSWCQRKRLIRSCCTKCTPAQKLSIRIGMAHRCSRRNKRERVYR